jgi:hypothetical protein
MGETYYLYLRYENKKRKIEVTDPNSNLEVLMDNLKHLQDQDGKFMFDMPNAASDGSIIDYYFGKMDENGQPIILHPKSGKTQYCLGDYNVKSGDTLDLVADPRPGGYSES